VNITAVTPWSLTAGSVVFRVISPNPDKAERWPSNYLADQQTYEGVLHNMSEFEELNPRFKESLLDWMKTRNPFWSLLGMEIIEVKKGWAKIRLPFTEKLANGLGVAHGGAIFSPADSAVGMALVGLINKNQNISTLEMKINYLKPFNSGAIVAEAKIIHKGTMTAIGDVEVRDEKDNLIAKGLATYAIFNKEPN
jgi:acyl-CoA thioesterase